MARERRCDTGAAVRKPHRPPNPVNRRAHRLVIALHEAVEQSDMNWHKLARKAGFNRDTFWRWRNAVTVPNVQDLERALDAAGYRMVLVSKKVKI